MAKLLEVVTRRIPARFGLDPIRDVQVLCPMNRGGLGARSLNLELQRLLKPARRGPGRVIWLTFGPGDKVMQVVNDYEKEVFDGISVSGHQRPIPTRGRPLTTPAGYLAELGLDAPQCPARGHSVGWQKTNAILDH